MKRINMLFTITALGLLSIGCSKSTAGDDNQRPKVIVLANIVNGKYVNIDYTYEDAEGNTEDTNKRVAKFYKIVNSKRVFQFTQIGPKKLDYDYDLFHRDSPYKLGDDIQIGAIVTQKGGGQSTESFSRVVKFTNNPPTVSDVKIDRAIFGAESKVSYTYSDQEGNSEDEAAVKVTWYRVRGGTETKLENPETKLRTYKISGDFQSGDILKVMVEAKARSGDLGYSNPTSIQLVIDDLSYTIAAKIAGIENIGTATVRGTVHNTAASPKKFSEVLNSYLTNDLNSDELNFILANRDVYTIRIVLGDRRDDARRIIIIDNIPNNQTKNLIKITNTKDRANSHIFEVTLTNTGQLTVESTHANERNTYGAVRGLTITTP